jgi:hypothetical protein
MHDSAEMQNDPPRVRYCWSAREHPTRCRIATLAELLPPDERQVLSPVAAIGAP